MSAGMPAFHVHLPGRIRSQSNARGHWSQRHRYAKAWRRDTAHLVADYMRVLERNGFDRIDPKMRKRITFTADVWSLMDDDNLESAIKPIRDGLQDAGVIDSDAPEAGHKFIYRQRIQRGLAPVVSLRIELR